MKITNKSYDIIKWIVVIVIPAVITLYSTLGGIWDFPLVQEITASLAAVDVFLGVIMKISSASYNKEYDGVLHVDTVNDEATDKYLFEVDDLDQLANKDKITLKIDAVSEVDSPVED